MAYVLILLCCSQFILHGLHLQDTPLYLFLNPYVLLMPLILIWVGDLALRRRTPDKNLFILLFVVALTQAYIVPAYERQPDFVSLYTKSIQFFWGPAVLLPGLLGLLRLWQVKGDPMEVARDFIKALSWILAIVTFIELFMVHVVGISALSIPWIGEASKNSEDIFPFRPWGVAIYPAVNAFIMAVMFWMSYLFGVRGVLHRVALVAALALTFSGTGQFIFLLLLPLSIRRPVAGVVLASLVLGAIVGLATAMGGNDARIPGLQRFDVGYTVDLAKVMVDALGSYFSRLSVDEMMFGSQTVNALSVLGLTHDWAYFDVFYAYGIIGLVVYLLMYGTLIFLSCPRQAGTSRRLYVMFILLAMNFHYGSLNYYLGQFVFAILAALQWQGSPVRVRVRAALALRPATPVVDPA